MPIPRHWPLLTLVFLDLIGFGMVIADIQVRAEKLLLAQGVKEPGFLIGAALTSMFVTQVLVGPIWGSIADRIGRKPVVLICTLISALSLVVYGLATSIEWIFASRILAGFAAANVAVSQAWISVDSPEEDRTAEMGKMSAAVTAGLILGPAIGGFLGKFGGTAAVGFTGAACSALGVLIVAFGARDVRGKAEPQKGEEERLSIKVLFREKRLVALMALSSTAWFALACLEGTFARLLNNVYGRDQLWFGIIFGFESLVGFLIQATLMKRISLRWSDKKLVTYGLIMQGVGLAVTPYLPVFGLVFAASALYSVGSALFGPSLNAWCGKITPDRLKGTMFGALQSARYFGFIVGPITGGWLFDRHNGAPYLLAGVVCLFASAVSVRMRE